MNDFTPSFFPFEEERRSQELAAAKADEQARLKTRQAIENQRIARKKQEAMEKASRRWKRDAKAKAKLKDKDVWAQCGISLYAGGSGWSHCTKCQQRLIYRSFKEVTEKPQICAYAERLAASLKARNSKAA